MAVGKLRYDKAYLQAPVPQVYVACYRKTAHTGDVFERLTYYGRAQMPYVQRLCHIGAAVVHYQFPALLCYAVVLILCKLLQKGKDIAVLQVYVYKAGLYALGCEYV